MADFSKQFCEKYMPEFFPGDFDIDELFQEIPKGHTMPIICEGYGFWGLHKGEDDKLYCLFEAEDGYTVPILYSEIHDYTYLDVRRGVRPGQL